MTPKPCRTQEEQELVRFTRMTAFIILFLYYNDILLENSILLHLLYFILVDLLPLLLLLLWLHLQSFGRRLARGSFFLVFPGCHFLHNGGQTCLEAIQQDIPIAKLHIIHVYTDKTTLT